MTAQQDLFPKKPKDVITPLTPKHIADAIRAKHAPPPSDDENKLIQPKPRGRPRKEDVT
jgi:hypothetical protein